jgi:Mannosyltransferase (PIG-V)
MSVPVALARRPIVASWEPDVRAAWPGWLAARAVVMAALLASVVWREVAGASPTLWQQFASRGLLGWDGDWYQRLATHGYSGVPLEGLRFFPLYPLIGRILGAGTWIGAGIALLLVANLCALLAAALVHRLTLTAGADPATARRAAIYFSIAPPAFVLVMGYSEGLAISLALVFVLALFSAPTASTIVVGILAGLVRPTGLLLAVPALVIWIKEERAGGRRLPARDRALRMASVLAPLAGTGLYLLWCQAAWGRWSLPFDVQNVPGLRGHFVDPLSTMVQAVTNIASGHLSNDGHEITVLITAALLVAGARRWPVALTAWGGASALVMFSAQHLGSVERYAWGSIVPLMTLAAVGGRRWHRAMLVVLPGALGVFATLAFTGHYVP